MEKQFNDLAIVQHARLRGALRELLNRHQREANQMQGATQDQTLVLRIHRVVLADALRLRPATHRLEELALAYAESVALENDRHRLYVDVGEALGRHSFRRVLVDHIEAQCRQLGLVEQSRLKNIKVLITSS